MLSLNFIGKLLPFITAATPGGFRIFVLGFAGFFLAQDSVVFFSTEFTLASFFVMISGIGFATILMKRMSEDESINVFLSYAFSCVFIGGTIACVSLLIISSVVPVPDFWPVLLLILTMSLYQVFRNFLVFKKIFWVLFLYDAAIAFFFIVAIAFFSTSYKEINSGSMLISLSVSYFLGSVAVFLLVIIKHSSESQHFVIRWIPVDDIVSSVIVGFSNAASSGVGFILPSLFVALGGSDIALVASLCAAVFSAMSALPRGLINNKASSLSKMVMLTEYSREVVDSLRYKINKLVFLLVPILSILLLLYFYVNDEVSDYWIVLFFVFAFSFNVATGQLGVIESVLINFCGYEKLSFYFNALVFLFILGVFGVIRLVPAAQGLVPIIYAVPLALGFINIFRMFWYRKMVARFFCIRN